MLSKKAYALEEIDQAVQFNEPIGPNHPFFTNFSNLRGDFEEKLVYKNLNVKYKNKKFTFNPTINTRNKTLLFLGGMRGTGKTSELAKYAQNLNTPDCFLCVTCNIDDELDMNNVEYMDILIFQLEKLTEILHKHDVKVDSGIIQKMETWFHQRTLDINQSLKGQLGLEVGGGIDKKGVLSSLLGFFGAFKLGVIGSRERAETIRQTFKDRFSNFANIFNEYIEEVNYAIRKAKIAQEVFFIVDGLEKTMSIETRKKIILEESNRLQKIKAYTLFTLPIELMKERQILSRFSNVEAFPFIKLLERDGIPIPEAFHRFEDFIYKRIDSRLFENRDMIEKAILYSGGSPRELLKILELTAFFSDEEKGKMESAALDKALHRLANQTAQYLTKQMLQKLIEIKEYNDKNMDVPYDQIIQTMLEYNLIMEYNSGNYKRPNPILELSNLYQQHVQV